MMKIIKATNKYSQKISELMLLELENPNPLFPHKMIEKFREHAKKENVNKEFDNPNLIAFLAIDKESVVGFIVGYENRSDNSAMIHYLASKKKKAKSELLKSFVKECKRKNLKKIIADTFEFMDNKDFFQTNGFKLIRKEKIADKLEMLWYEFNS
jgi:N-acetylglutamate synthase-like GNAT family acetyltransferase